MLFINVLSFVFGAGFRLVVKSQVQTRRMCWANLGVKLQQITLKCLTINGIPQNSKAVIKSTLYAISAISNFNSEL